MDRKLFVGLALVPCLVCGAFTERASAQDTSPAKAQAVPKFVPPQINETLSAEKTQIETEIEKQLDTYSKSLDAIYPLLTHPNPKVREEAINRLSYKREEVELLIPPIADRLSDPNLDVARNAAYLLKNLGPKSVAALPALMWAIEQEDKRYEMAFSAIGALGAAGAPAVPRLIRFASANPDNAPEIVDQKLEGAIEALGEIGPAAAAARTILATHLQKWQHSEEAGIALGKIGAEDLLLAEFDQQEEAERGAVDGLGYLAKPSPKVLPALEKYIARNEKDEYDRAAAYRAAGRLRPTTLEILAMLGRGLKDSEEHVREETVEVIGEIEPALPQAIPHLLTGLADEHKDVREEAARALGRLKVSPEVRLEALLKAGVDGDHSIRGSVGYAIYNSAEDFWPELWKRVQDASTPAALRAYTIVCLNQGFYKHDEEYGPLIAAVMADEKQEQVVRIAAACMIEGDRRKDADVVELLRSGLKLEKADGVLELALSRLTSNGEAEDVPLIMELLKKRIAGKLRTDECYYAFEMLGPKAAAAVPELVAQLKVPHAEKQGQIISALGAIGPAAKEALPPLMDAYFVKSEYGSRNLSALYAIGNIAGPLEENQPKVVDFLIGILNERPEDYGSDIAAAAQALGKMGPRGAKAVPKLIPHLQSIASYHRDAIIQALGNIGPDSSPAVNALIKFVVDPEKGNQHNAIVALGQIGAQEDDVIPVLAPLLSDSRFHDYALKAITAYGSKAKLAVPALVEQLKFGDSYDKTPLLDALAAIGPEATDAFAPILELLKNSEKGDYTLRERSKRALEAIAPDDPRLAEAIRAELRDERSLRDYVDEHESEAGTILFDMLKSKEAEERKLSIEMLMERYPKGTRAAVEAAIDDPDPQVQQAAAVALAQFGKSSEEQVNLLLAGLLAAEEEELDWRLRNAIQTTMAPMGPRLLAVLGDDQVPLKKRRQILELLSNNVYSLQHLKGPLEAALVGSSAEVQQAAAILLVFMRIENPKIPAQLKAALETDPATTFIPRLQVFQAITSLADRVERPLSAKIVDEILHEICEGDMEAASSYTYQLRRARLDEAQTARLLKLLDDDERRELGYTALANAEYSAPEKVVAVLLERLPQAEEDQRYHLANALKRQREAALAPLLALATDAAQPLAVRLLVLQAVAEMEKLSLDDARKLVPLLKDENAQVREWTAIVLSKVANKADPLLPHLTTALAEEDYNLRGQASYTGFATLKERAAPAVPEIIKLLKHEDEQVRSTAVETLGYLGPGAEAAVPSLIDALIAEEEGYVRDSIAGTLKRIGKPAEEILLTALPQSTGKDRVALLPLFIKFRNESVVPELQKSLASEDKAEQRAAAMALSCFPQADDACVAVLMEMTQDQDEEQVRMGIEGLGRMGEKAKAAVPLLQEKLDDRNLRYYTLQTLGRMKGAAEPAVPAMIELLEHPEHSGIAAQMLGEIGSPTATDALLAELDNSNRNWAVAGALAKIKPSPVEQTLPILFKQLKDPYRRSTVLVAIEAFGPDAKGAIPVLIQALDTTDLEFLGRCLSALSTVGDGSPEVAEVLLKYMDDKSPDVQRVATYALGRVGALPEKCVPVLMKRLAGEEQQQRAAIAALGGFHADAATAVPVLVKEHFPNPQLQSEVIVTLGEIGPAAAQASVPLLVDLLEKAEARGQYQAIECLGNFGPAAKEALPVLEPLTKDSNLEIQYPALRAYWKIDPARAKELGLYSPRENEEYEYEYEDY